MFKSIEFLIFIVLPIKILGFWTTRYWYVGSKNLKFAPIASDKNDFWDRDMHFFKRLFELEIFIGNT